MTPPTLADLLNAETCLRFIGQNLAIKCSLEMEGWSRDVMKKNVDDRSALLRSQRILLDEAERIMEIPQ